MKTPIAALLLLASVASADDQPATTEEKPAEEKKEEQKEEVKTAAIEQPTTTESVAISKEAPQQGTTKAIEVGETRFELHGYARMPLSAQSTPREPYLVDNDYYLSGFAYTRLYEPDWSELFFSAKHGDYEAKFGLFASLYSDYATARLENQLGVAQASVSAKHFAGVDPLSVQVGVFWDRFGYLEPYDTYVFGRTHQGGAKVAYELPGGGRVQTGIGLHQAQLQQNLGLTPVAHIAGAYPVGPVELATSASSRPFKTARCTSAASTRATSCPKTAARPTSRSATTAWTTCSTSRPRWRSCTPRVAEA
jgi:hypothetical protein